MMVTKVIAMILVVEMFVVNEVSADARHDDQCECRERLSEATPLFWCSSSLLAACSWRCADDVMGTCNNDIGAASSFPSHYREPPPPSRPFPAGGGDLLLE